jgi:hypothetical protein
VAFAHYRRNLANNGEVLVYFEQATPVRYDEGQWVESHQLVR